MKVKLTETSNAWFAEWMRLTLAMVPHHAREHGASKGALLAAAADALTTLTELGERPVSFPHGDGTARFGFSASEPVGFWLEVDEPDA